MIKILKWFKRKPKDKREKVSETDARAIRIMVHSGDSQAKVARHFNISRQKCASYSARENMEEGMTGIIIIFATCVLSFILSMWFLII